MSEQGNGYLVVVVGGAVAGSEAVFQLREKGFRVVCIEQNPLPFGKIEDGLPRWHVEQRKKEEEKICERLNHPLVHFVPSTKVGKTFSLDEILKWKPSAVLFASGAWKDRPLGLDGVDDYVGKGLVYQNPLVHWFNHYHEPSYSGTRYEIPDDTIVIGGGLASLDVLKICQMELVQRALKKKGIAIDMLTLEKDGVPKTLEHNKLKWDDLGIKGSTLYYRRRIIDMPLADAPPNATPEQDEKFQALKQKIFTNYQSKFLFQYKECHLPVGSIVKNGRLTGLRFIRTEIVDKKVKQLPGTELDVSFNMVISSIGSIPEEIPGIPMKGETFKVVDVETGEVEGMSNVFLLGNAVTGKGNIRVSLVHGRQVAQLVAERLLADPSKKLSDTAIAGCLERVKELQKKAGYDGHFKEWVETQLAKRQTTAH